MLEPRPEEPSADKPPLRTQLPLMGDRWLLPLLSAPRAFTVGDFEPSYGDMSSQAGPPLLAFVSMSKDALVFKSIV